MPVISIKKHKATKRYICDICRRQIQPDDLYYRLFGYAYREDGAYETKECSDCIESSESEEVKKLLKKLGGKA